MKTNRSYEQTIWFRNCLIANNVSDGITFNLNHAGLDHCTIANNGGVGLNMTYYGNVEVVSCTISANQTGVQSHLYETRLEMKSSNLVGNRLAAIEVKTDQDFQCRGNYWGTNISQQIALMILDGFDNRGRGVVVFNDFVPKRIVDAGCSLKPSKD